MRDLIIAHMNAARDANAEEQERDVAERSKEEEL